MKLAKTVVYHNDEDFGTLLEQDTSILRPGMVVYLKDGRNFLVGDATPYEGVDGDGCGDGWVWDDWYCSTPIDRIEYYEY